jgi:outer membrane biosynthesis protein TonB
MPSSKTARKTNPPTWGRGSSKQRIEVWRGQREKTSGGLTRDQLTKNKRGKIVSKKKSNQASNENNLGAWLRDKGTKIAQKEMLRKKGEPPADAPKKAAAKPRKVPAKPAKVAPKPKPAPKKAVKPKIVPKKPVPKPVVKEVQPKKKRPGAINPLTQQAYEKKGGRKGTRGGAMVTLDNVLAPRARRRKGPKFVVDF